MRIQSITGAAFAPYGKIVRGFALAPLLDVLTASTPKPSDHVVYVPHCPELAALPVCMELQTNFFGGMPMQAGYCNGANHRLNCLEYHRDSEVNAAADDVVLLLARQQDIAGGQLDTQCVEAFLLPAGTAVELYATTLHYAPCNAPKNSGFRVAVLLPEGTNTEKPALSICNDEDRMLWARNKWLLAHPDAPEARQGAYVGLRGVNLSVPD